MDILIKGGLIVDGTGEKPFYGDIAIDRDMITEIGENLDASKARKVVDAKGLTVTPGFIDGHTHSELNILKNRQHPNALYQGISTVVTGQCGLGFAPMKPEQFEDSIKINSGIFGDYRHYLKGWTTFGEFLDQLDGSGVNVAANVSHNAIRQMVTGFKNVVWSEKERREAQEVIRQTMKEGAVGFSVGLSYYPGGYSDTEELIALCQIVQEYDGLFCVHQRLDDGQVPLRPRYEAAEIARKTGVRLNMLHYRTGSMEEDYRTLFEPFKDIEAAGNKVYYEYYPYMVGAGLVLALVPGWAQQGSYAEIMERLTSKELLFAYLCFISATAFLSFSSLHRLSPIIPSILYANISIPPIAPSLLLLSHSITHGMGQKRDMPLKFFPIPLFLKFNMFPFFHKEHKKCA